MAYINRQMRRALWLSAALVLVVFAAGLAAVQSRSYEVTTEHYSVSTDVSERFSALVAQHMEAIYKEYTRRLRGYEMKVFGRFEVKVFARRDDYDGAVPEKLRGSTGAFVSEDKALMAYKEGRTDEAVFRTLYHEGFHQFMYSCVAQNAPLWVNEGLAEYFSQASWQGRGFVTGHVPTDPLRLVQKAIKEHTYIRLEELFTMEAEGWLRNIQHDESRASLQYAEAWSVVHFLIHSAGGRSRAKLLVYLRKISDGTSHANAFRESFGSDLKGFERAWADYMMRLRPGRDAICRKNMELVAFLALAVYEEPRRFSSLEKLRRTLLDNKRYRWNLTAPDGEEISSGDSSRIASLFRCPHDKRQRAVSYVLLKNPQTGLPVLFCPQHPGVVMKAYYVRRGPEDYEVKVEQQVRATLPAELARALQKRGR